MINIFTNCFLKRRRFYISLIVIFVLTAVFVTVYEVGFKEEKAEKTEGADEKRTQIEKIYTEEYQDRTETRIKNAKLSGNYTEECMFVEPNPYGTNTLSLYVYFCSEMAAKVSYTVSVSDNEISDFSVKPQSENEYKIEHEFQVIGLIPDMKNKVTFTITYEDNSQAEYEYTYDMGDLAGEEETRLDVKDVSEKADDQLTEGLYVILGNDSDGLDFMYYYDNEGVLRGEVPLIGYRSHRLLFDDGLMYYSISETQIAAMNSLGKIERIYDTGAYELHHDYVFDNDGNLLVLATDTESESVEDIVIRIDKNTGEITGMLDLGDLFADYKGKCTEAEDGDLDWIHINTIQFIGNDTLILSSRETSTIMKISKAFSSPKVEYMIGSCDFWKDTGYENLLLKKDINNGEFSDTGGQHTVTYVDDDSLAEGQYYLYMFNNNFGTSESRKFDWTVIDGIETSVKEGKTSYYYKYLVDEKSGTYTLVYSFEVPFSAYVSSAQEYQNNIIIDSGMEGTFGEYDPDGNLLRKYNMRLAKNYIYRVYKYDFEDFFILY